MRELAHILLHEPGSLAPGERELIATYVSAQNDCYFCQTSHGAAAASHLGNDDVIQQVKTDFQSAEISPKLKALLAIAGKVQSGGKNVTSDDIAYAAARAQPTSRFTTRCSSPPPSVCTTATSTAWEHGSRVTRRCTRKWVNILPNTAIESLRASPAESRRGHP